MNCCVCDNKMDIKCAKVPATWFGRYIGNKLTAVICAECIKDPRNKVKWRSIKP